jgi:ribosomal protein S18 acetylase RimI-like enzyme
MADDVTLRAADGRDLDGLVRLALAFRDHQRQSWPSESEFRAALARLLDDAATELLIAEADGGELGYVMVRYRFSAWIPGECAEIEDVFVTPGSRRAGLGRRLVALAIARAERRGCRLVSLTTNERNAAALALYESLGFRAERERWDGGRALWLERWRP